MKVTSMIVAVALVFAAGTTAAKPVTKQFGSWCPAAKLKTLGGDAVLKVGRVYRCGNINEVVLDDAKMSWADYRAKLQAAKCLHTVGMKRPGGARC